MSISSYMKATEEYVENVKASAKFISEKISKRPKIAIVLGSGLGNISNSLKNPISFPYSDIPGFPVSTAPGHKGELLAGEIENQEVLLMNGRFHYYEGYDMKTVTFPIRVFQELGVEILVVTNASGGLNPDFEIGHPMFIRDLINMMGDNPLIGPNVEEWGPRFPDMSEPFSNELTDLAINCAKELGVGFYEGNYVGVAGPCFETKAELRLMRHQGGDAVGMSTVPEVIAAVHGGLKVLGISAITDRAVPDDLKPITAEEVIEVAERTGEKMAAIILELLRKLK